VSLRPRPGVSLIEALIVLAVLAVVVGLLLPRLDTAEFRAETNVRHIRSTFSEASSLARERGAPVILGIDVEGSHMRLLVDANHNGTADSGEFVQLRGLPGGAHFAAQPMGLRGVPVNAVEGPAVTAVDALPSITFQTDGVANGDLVVYLTVSTRRGSAVRAVSLTASTAVIREHKLSGGVWKEVGS